MPKLPHKYIILLNQKFKLSFVCKLIYKLALFRLSTNSYKLHKNEWDCFSKQMFNASSSPAHAGLICCNSDMKVIEDKLSGALQKNS